MRGRRPAEQPLHRQRRRDAVVLPQESRDIGKVVGKVLRVHGHHAVQRGRDPVDAEYLVVRRVVGLRLDEPLSGELVVVPACHGIFQNKFKGSVALFGDLTGDAVGERTESERGENDRVRSVQYGDRSVTHLGSTVTEVMPPLNTMLLIPGYSIGKPSPVTRSFLGSVLL